MYVVTCEVHIKQRVSRAERMSGGEGFLMTLTHSLSTVHYWNAAATVAYLRMRCWCSCPVWP
jgi:hypothetical protein